MKFRLDTQHYIHDRLLEPGHIIGDETDVPMVNADGSEMKPSRSMTPVDDEAWGKFQEVFPGVHRPERDPTKAIPLRGSGDTAKAPPLFVKGPDGQVHQPGGRNPTKTLGDQPGSYVIGPDGNPTNELKKGLPDPGSPNHPVGQPVIGTPGLTSPHVPPKPQDPAMRVVVPQAEQEAVLAAQRKAQEDAAKAKAPEDPSKGKK